MYLPSSQLIIWFYAISGTMEIQEHNETSESMQELSVLITI